MDLSQRQVIDLPIDSILPNRFQPRIKYDDQQIYELAESIKVHGVFQPILVRRLGDKYEIIAGERRYKASVIAGRQTIPAIIRDISDKDSMEVALIENVQRSDLTPIEEALSYKRVLDKGNMTQDELAKKLGKNQSTIANKVRLLNLDEEVQEALLESRISERHARSLLKLKDRKDQINMLNHIINDRLTVRKTDEEINKLLSEKDNIDIKETDDIDYNIPISPVIIDDLVEEKMDNNFQNNDVQYAQNTMLNSSVINTEQNNNVIDNTPVADLYGNIDNMVNNAQTINFDKPVNDMDKLLTPDEATKEVKVEEVPQFIPGKFFNIPNENYKEEVVQPSNDFSNPFTNINVTNEVPSTPIKEEIPSLDEILRGYTMEDNQPTNVQNDAMDIFGSNANDDFNTPITPNVEKEEILTMPPLNPVNNNQSPISEIEKVVKELQDKGAKIDYNIYDLDTIDQIVIRIQKDNE